MIQCMQNFLSSQGLVGIFQFFSWSGAETSRMEPVGEHTHFCGVAQFIAAVDHGDAVDAVIQNLNQIHSPMSRKTFRTLRPVGNRVMVVHIPQNQGSFRVIMIGTVPVFNKRGCIFLTAQNAVYTFVP